jgi:hypothetical protein
MRLASCLILFGFATASAAPAADPEPREKTWFEQVERDRDRGSGRVVDRATWQVQRAEEVRDVRLGRAEPRSAFDRFEEDRDRELQIESIARRKAGQPPRGIGAADSVIVNEQGTTGGGAGLPTLAAVVAKDQRDLADAKEKLDRSLRAVDAAEARELRLLRRRLTREGKAETYDAERVPVEQRFNRLRAEHERAYDTIRRPIVGSPQPSLSR